MKILLKAFITLLPALFVCPCFSQEFLKASNSRIVSGSKEILLRGIGLGGWMLQEPYMLGLSDGAANQTQIKSKIKALVGDANTTAFYNAWLANHVRKADVDSVVVMNSTDDKISYKLWIAGKAADAISLPHSISTVVIK